jgi:hypothetical protein
VDNCGGLMTPAFQCVVYTGNKRCGRIECCTEFCVATVALVGIGVWDASSVVSTVGTWK